MTTTSSLMMKIGKRNFRICRKSSVYQGTLNGQSQGNEKVIPHPKKTRDNKPKGHVTLPYVGRIIEYISWKLRKSGIVAHVRPHITLRRLLVAPKD